MNSDIHSLLAPYALDALDPDERARFETHIEQCEPCRTELVGFIETTARMGAASEHVAPQELRDRLMSAVSRTPQHRPVVAALASHHRMRRALPRILVAASLLAALAGFGSYALERRDHADLKARQSTMTAVLTASDTQMEAMTLPHGGEVKVIASTSAHGALLVTANMPKLPARSYQLWTLKAGKATSQGLITTASSVSLVQNTDGADTVAITIEPEGGSPQPTTTPIMSAPI